MDAFFSIVLSIIVLRMFFRSNNKEPDAHELRRNTVYARWERKRIKAEKLKQQEKSARKALKEIEKQKQRDAELISVILPTINSDK